MLGPWLEISIATDCQRCGIHKNNGEYVNHGVSRIIYYQEHCHHCTALCLFIQETMLEHLHQYISNNVCLSLICATQLVSSKLTYISSLRPRWSWWSLCMKTKQMKCTLSHAPNKNTTPSVISNDINWSVQGSLSALLHATQMQFCQSKALNLIPNKSIFETVKSPPFWMPSSGKEEHHKIAG